MPQILVGVPRLLSSSLFRELRCSVYLCFSFYSQAVLCILVRGVVACPGISYITISHSFGEERKDSDG